MAGLTPSGGSASGNVASGTSATVTLPAGYLTTDYITLILSKNQTDPNPFDLSAALTGLTELSNAGARRLLVARVIPNGTGQPNFTITSHTAISSVWEWWIGNWGGLDLTAQVFHAENAVGSSASSALAPPPLTTNYVFTGNEIAISVGGVNATATWTTDAGTTFNTGTAVNAGMMIDAVHPTVGASLWTPPSMDRGLNGTTRNQQALSLILQADPLGALVGAGAGQFFPFF